MRSHRRGPAGDPAGRLADGSPVGTSADPHSYRAVPVAGLAVLREPAGAADPLGGTAIPTDVVSALRRRQGGGSALPSQLADAGEQALGVDLSGVRVHADPEAASIARSVQAVAFTHGSDIYFSQGSYRPSDPGGQRLIAHELGHVGQPDGGGGVIGRADDPAETAADRSADTVLSALRRTAAPTVPSPDVAGADDAGTVLPALRRQAHRSPTTGRTGQSIRRMIGKGGKDVYWFTEKHALAAVLAPLAGTSLTVDFGGKSVVYDAGARTSAEQWVSSDTAWGGNSFHFTLGFDRVTLTVSGEDDAAIFVNAEVRLKNLHATLRRTVDSAWIGANIGEILAVQNGTSALPQLQQAALTNQYKGIQQNSLHAGIGKRWSGGNKDNTAAAAHTLGLSPQEVATGIGDLIDGVSRSLGYALEMALNGKDIAHPSAAKPLRIRFADVLWDGTRPDMDGMLLKFHEASPEVPDPPVASVSTPDEDSVATHWRKPVPAAAV